MGVEAALKLDFPSEDVLKRRMEGQKYLASKLGGGSKDAAAAKKNGDGASGYHGPSLSASLVDCRFALAKVCMPLLRELEFQNAGRNFISRVRNGISNAATRDSASASAAGGMLTVVTEDGVARPYVGNDAVHTMGVESFYAPIQEEISRRMKLDCSGSDNEAMLRFCPIAMNGALEKNVELVKRLTGMDKVSISWC